ncbi:MAG: DNA mismatch repair protein MutS [Eubacteriales bacterium]
MALTPMMRQYMDIKKEYPDAILFFRLGDFYEMFFEDALVASKAMEIALTGKACGQEERAPMCGVPFHSAETYIARLIDKGFKVAICEQVEDPALAKGIVKREVVQVITPGTVLSQNMLKENENNYIAAVNILENGIGFAYCDISTGEFAISNISFGGFYVVFNELAKIGAKELLICEDLFEFLPESELKQNFTGYVNSVDSDYFKMNDAEFILRKQFNLNSLMSIGLEEGCAAIFAAVALLSYIKNTRKQEMDHIYEAKVYNLNSHMALDKATLRNLEITQTLYENKVQGSLLGILDKTCTAMGARRLKQWLKEPLNEKLRIEKRLDAVESISEDVLLQNNLRECLKSIYDLERLSARVSCNNANARDLIALRNSLFNLPQLKDTAKSFANSYLDELADQISEKLDDVCEIIQRAISDDAPISIKEGGIIKSGFNDKLDEMKFSIKDGKEWIASLENIERQRTGIKKLKVGYNKVFGYYIEISKSNLGAVPENYIRKQTLVNCERFITEELKAVESTVLGAEAKINLLEYDIFCELRLKLSEYIKDIQNAAKAISKIDVLSGFAKVCIELSYVKPEISDDYVLEIKNGRHPVIENSLKEGGFISNDVYIDNKDVSMLLITGPNMAGKSTYMRQTALIVLMAQIGSFVPADFAKIGVVDRIYTRIGASDNLSQGQSTFFVEMNELAYILNTATSKSLILLDEIGRGTSTYDGLSIAMSVAYRLCKEGNQIRSMFATHYHEMTMLEEKLPGLCNYNVDISEENGEVIFLHKIVKGSANKSYGIHVAKLAGVPNDVLQNAQKYLKALENGNERNSLEQFNTKRSDEYECLRNDEKSNHEDIIHKYQALVNKINEIDEMKVSPIELYAILAGLKEIANEE